jgi:hypothetical protein
MAKQNQILKVLAIGAAAAGIYYLFFKKKKGTIAKGDTIMNSASSSTPALPPTKPTTPTASPRVPSTSTTTTPAPKPAASYETWIVNTKSTPLNVRGGAGTNFPIVTTLAKGTEVKARQSSISGWIEILDITGYFPKVIGYASSQYLIKK